MADEDRLQPGNDGDITPPPATTEFQPGAPLKDAGVDFSPSDASGGTGDGSGNPKAETGGAGDTARENLSGFGAQATDRLRQAARDGKDKVGGLLDQLARMLTDAAGEVDDKLGGQFGGYARDAASQVQGLAQSVRDKDVDDLVSDIRGYVRQSPAAALGIAAVLGFAVARVAHAGFDQRT